MATLNPNAPTFIPDNYDNRVLVYLEQQKNYATSLQNSYPISQGISHAIQNGESIPLQTTGGTFTPSNTPLSTDRKMASSVAAQALVGVASQGVKSGIDLITTGMNFRLEKLRLGMQEEQLQLQRDQFNFQQMQFDKNWESASRVGLSNPAQFGNLGTGGIYFAGRTPQLSKSQLTVGNSSPYGFV
nr:MAG: hypothetical protein [Jingmen shrew picorna-like virus 1]